MVDEAAIAELYTRHGHVIYRRCYSLVGRPEEAQELVQETFCQFLRGLSRFENRSSAFTFLYRIATNLSIDRLRRRGTVGVAVAFDDSKPHACREADSAQRAMALEELAVLTQGLDDNTLTTAVMAHVDGLTQEEIAAALDVSRRTVGKRLKRFLAHTRKRAAVTLGLPVMEATGRAHGE